MGEETVDKSGAAVRFPPPVAAIITIIAGFGFGQVFPLLPNLVLPTPMRYWAGGAIIVAAIAVFGYWPISLFRKTEQNVTPWSDTPEIIVAGPYKFTRNPMYLMMLLVCAGFSVILAEIWILILTPVLAMVLYLIAIKHEEKYLEEKFGDSYRAYRNTVRRWL